jgi:hypothetical protein
VAAGAAAAGAAGAESTRANAESNAANAPTGDDAQFLQPFVEVPAGTTRLCMNITMGDVSGAPLSFYRKRLRSNILA